MSEYFAVKSSKLKLKGEKSKSKKKKVKSTTEQDEGTSQTAPTVEQQYQEDAENHAGWFKITRAEDVTGCVIIEFSPYSYVRSLDNGFQIASAPHRKGEEPDQEEMLTAVKIDDTKVAFKTGFGKYLSVDGSGKIIGNADAIGGREQFEVVSRDGLMAICSWNGKFLKADEDQSGLLVVGQEKATDENFLALRSKTDPNVSRKDKLNKLIPSEEKGSEAEAHLNYIKKFQSYQGKMDVSTGDHKGLKRAREEGRLHQELLDRRSKMKADKFCK